MREFRSWTILAASLISLGLVTVAAQGDDLVFDRTDIPVGGAPAGIVAADFDGDDILDLAVANSGESSVTILIGDGAGGFAEFCVVSVGGEPTRIACGDFDQDGALDLAVTNYAIGDNTVSIVFGDGNGCFSNRNDLTGVARPWGIVTADFNNDAHLDLAVANTGASQVSVFHGEGTGIFSLESQADVPNGPPQDLALGSNLNSEVDPFGRHDLATTVPVTSWCTLMGNSIGGFGDAECSGTGNYYDVVTGFFDDDNHEDVAMTAQTVGPNDLIKVNLLDGVLPSVGETVNLPVGASPQGLICADVDGDGKDDFICCNSGSDNLSIWLGMGGGSYTEAANSPFDVGSAPRYLVSGDFNGDELTDLAVTNQFGNSVSVLLNGQINCRIGSVNTGVGERTNVLYVNGSVGTGGRIVSIPEGSLIWAAMFLPPEGGNGKFVVHANLAEPTNDSATPLPASIGTFCFPFLLPQGGNPAAVWNNIGRTNKVGESEYFDGSPLPDPARAPTVFLLLYAGDAVNLPAGTIVTLQGVIMDAGAISAKGASTTNAVVVKIL